LEEFKEKPIEVKSEEQKGSVFTVILKNHDPSLISEEEDIGDP